MLDIAHVNAICAKVGSAIFVGVKAAKVLMVAVGDATAIFYMVIEDHTVLIRKVEHCDLAIHFAQHGKRRVGTIGAKVIDAFKGVCGVA